MKVLVVGTLPPAGGARAAELGAYAASLIDVGDEVELLSPEHRSIAHASRRLDGLRLARELRRRSDEFDGLVLRIQSDLPMHPATGRVERALVLLALCAALRRYGHLTLFLDAPAPIPGGLGGRAAVGLWDRAEHIFVHSLEDRRQLLLVPGVDQARITLVDELDEDAPELAVSPPRRSREVPWPDVDGLDGRAVAAEVLIAVRERAIQRRRFAEALADSLEDLVPEQAPRSSEPAEAGGFVSVFDDEGLPRISKRSLVRLVAGKVLRRLHLR